MLIRFNEHGMRKKVITVSGGRCVRPTRGLEVLKVYGAGSEPRPSRSLSKLRPLEPGLVKKILSLGNFFHRLHFPGKGRWSVGPLFCRQSVSSMAGSDRWIIEQLISWQPFRPSWFCQAVVAAVWQSGSETVWQSTHLKAKWLRVFWILLGARLFSSLHLISCVTNNRSLVEVQHNFFPSINEGLDVQLGMKQA